jgi:hypothetical protein
MAAARKGQAALAAQVSQLEAQRLRDAQDPYHFLLPACAFAGERRVGALLVEASAGAARLDLVAVRG